MFFYETECFARDSNRATAPRMVKQFSALSITPFRPITTTTTTTTTDDDDDDDNNNNNNSIYLYSTLQSLCYAHGR